ncbi:hypothetical protein AK830_g10985 [Neonectria ditissima]|uniref:Uncharacterized protein n=1 Tax=Neonectria ditissima TaxID=78410 RepID=A0A0P7B983_9HYPO|nr:hypothetical protein AK830_g10985 [Neonectria ditissima]
MGNSRSKVAPNPQISAETASRGLPQTFRLSYKKGLSLKIVCYLTDPGTDVTYALSVPDAWYGGLILHDGPSIDHTPLATVTREGKGDMDFGINLPALESAGIAGGKEILRYMGTFKKEIYWFGTQVGEGDNRHIEKFEWRHSRGSEVKSIGQSGSGWKLVRLGSSIAGEGNNEVADRGDGFTKDGKEIVAVWADGKAFKSISNIGEFQFRGSGATGELGTLWGLTAMMSYLCIWLQTMLQASVASGASAA